MTIDHLNGLADKVIITNATGNEVLFLKAVEELVAGVRKMAKDDPVSDEAKALGILFCCGKYERLGHEVAALRNVVQSAMLHKVPGVVETWNRYFPDEQHPVPEQPAVPPGVMAMLRELHEEAVLSEGQISKALGVDRITCRIMLDEAPAVTEKEEGNV